MEFKEFVEFTNPEEKDYDITSSFSKTERAKKTSRENKISQIFTELLGDLGFPELYELAPYGIADEEYTHPSLDTIKKLKEEGNNIYIITARYEQDGIESVEGLTEEWLKKNKIEYDRLLINSSDKLKIAREYNIDVFIDDCFKFCKERNDAGIKSYMFVGTTNNNIETGEVEKVYSWPQVYFKIKEFTQKTQ